VTHNTNLYGTIAFLGRQSLAIEMPFCVSARRRKLRRRRKLMGRRKLRGRNKGK